MIVIWGGEKWGYVFMKFLFYIVFFGLLVLVVFFGMSLLSGSYFFDYNLEII